jgi:hypothetical protein
MDYPAPWVFVDDDGELDFGRAYDTGIGAWDKLTARWLYGEYDNPATALPALLDEARAQGLHFVADEHARAVSTAHPRASVWDNGSDPVTELQRVLAVRRVALDRFDSTRIGSGEPLAGLREVLTPIYLYHRYQLAAAAKAIGGVVFDYRVERRPPPPLRPVDADAQRRAIAALVATLDTTLLELPEGLLAQLPPANDGLWFPLPREGFAQRTGVAFDALAAAATAVDLAFDALLDPARLERLTQAHALDPGLPSTNELFDAIEDQLVAQQATRTPRRQLLAGLLLERYAARLMALADAPLSAATAAAADARLAGLQAVLADPARRDPLGAQKAWLADRIARHRTRPAPPAVPVGAPLPTPPGSPIGAATSESCWHCDPLPPATVTWR